MSEASTIARIVLVFGIVFSLVIFLYPGEETGWDRFQGNVQTLPSFNDPFAEGSITLPLEPNANGSTVVQKDITTIGCVEADFWECVRFNDANAYIRADEPTGSPDVSRFQVQFNDPPAGDRFLVGFQVDVVCRGDPDRSLLIVLDSPPGGPSILMNPNPAFCANTTTFQRLAFYMPNENNFFTWANVTTMEVSVFVQDEEDTGGAVDVIYVLLTIFGSTEQVGCDVPDGAWFPWVDEAACAAGQTGAIIGKGITFVLNGFDFVGQAISYGFGLLIGFGEMVGFLFNIPDTPDFIQGIITVFIVACILIVILRVLSLIRGTGVGI